MEVNEGAKPILRKPATAQTPRGEDAVIVMATKEEEMADDNSFLRAISTMLVTAQVFALMPVCGVRENDATCLRFSWCSLRMLWTLLVLLGSVFMTVLATMHMFSLEMTFDNSANCVFFGTTFLTLLLFLQLARRWPLVAQRWQVVEHSMASYGYPRYLAVKLKLMTAVLMSVALVEHVLSNVKEVERALYCADDTHPWLAFYFTRFYPEVFSVTRYAHWKGALVIVIKVLATFSWNFMDLFVMLVSVALCARLKQVNARLRQVRARLMAESFWNELRQDYNNLSCLTKTVDLYISKIVLLSFANNLYFICLQLLNTIKPMGPNGQDVLYFYWSFAYLLARTCAVSLYAASIHDESKEPKSVLFSVPQTSYCIEVERFLTQVLYDEVALTGLNFFSVTRKLMLTVAGTIVTYEIVLVQLNAAPSTSHNVTQDLNISCVF